MTPNPCEPRQLAPPLVVSVAELVARVPGIRRRRVRAWAVAVIGVVSFLLVQTVVPGLRILPGFLATIGPATILLVFLAALFCEFLDSSLGMGYGTTLSPLLLVMGFEPLDVVPAVLLSELCTGLSAGLFHHRDGNIDLKHDRRALMTFTWLTSLSVMGALAAVTLAVRISTFWLTVFIGGVIVSAGLVIVITRNRPLRYRPAHMVAVGLIAAFNKGLSGGGYGPLATAGQVISGISVKSAVAITSMAEAAVCLVGLTGYLWLGKQLNWALVLPLTIGAMFSVPLATLTIRRLPALWVRSIVGAATCALGVFTLAKVFW